MYAIYSPGMGALHIIRVENGVAEFVAMTANPDCAERIRDLLTRNGMVDVPLEDVEA